MSSAPLARLGMPTLLELPSLEATVAFCKTLGLTLIELNLTRPAFLPSTLPADALRRITERDGIEFTVHLSEEIDLASFHDEVREAWIRNTVRTLQWAGAGGIALATMHLAKGVYYTMPGGKVWLYNEYLTEYLQRLKDALSIIRSQTPENLRLCVENCGDFSLPFIQRALDETALDLTWDVGHDAMFGFSDSAYIRPHADRVRHMHLHDVIDGRPHRGLYTGQVDVDEALRFARERQLRVIIEVKTADSLAESIQHLNTKKNSMRGDEQ